MYAWSLGLHKTFKWVVCVLAVTRKATQPIAGASSFQSAKPKWVKNYNQKIHTLLTCIKTIECVYGNGAFKAIGRFKSQYKNTIPIIHERVPNRDTRVQCTIGKKAENY